MFEQFRQERVSLIAKADSGLREVRRQGGQERARYEDQWQRTELEIQLLHRVLQAANRNASEILNASGVATAELAPAQAHSCTRISHSDPSNLIRRQSSAVGNGISEEASNPTTTDIPGM